MSEQPAKLVIRKADHPDLEKTQQAWKDFNSVWSKLPNIQRGTHEVYGKRVSKATKKELAKLAAKILAENFSVFEMARILKDEKYSLEAYMKTLCDIRDDTQMSTPKDRMTAADKIMQTTLAILKANDKEEPAPETLTGPDVEATRNLTAVLVNVQKELPTMTQQITEPNIPKMLEADVVEAEHE